MALQGTGDLSDTAESSKDVARRECLTKIIRKGNVRKLQSTLTDNDLVTTEYLLLAIDFCEKYDEKKKHGFYNKNHKQCFLTSWKMLELLLKCKELKAGALNNGQLMFHAANIKNLTALILLIKNPLVDINATNKNDENILFVLLKLVGSIPNLILNDLVAKQSVFDSLISRKDLNINRKDASTGKTAFISAAKLGYNVIARFLLNRNDTELIYEDSEEKTAFDYIMKPVRPNKFRSVDLALAHDVFMDERSTPMRTRYMKVALQHSLDFVQYHLSKNPNSVKWVYELDNNILLKFFDHHLFCDRYLQTIILLLQEGSSVDVNVQDGDKQTALMKAVKSCREPLPVIKLLLKQGADVNIQDAEKQTALMIAVKQKLSESIVAEIANHPKCDLLLKNKFQQDVVQIFQAMPEDYNSNNEIRTLLTHLLEQQKLNANPISKDMSLSDIFAKLKEKIEDNNFSKARQDYLQQQISYLESDMAFVDNNSRDSEVQGMTREHRHQLIAKRVFICEELIPSEVLNYLYQDQILTEDLFEEINHAPTRKRKVEMLLSVLPLRGQTAFESFVKALKETKQDHIAEALESEIEGDLATAENNEEAKFYQVVRYFPFQSGVFTTDILGARVQVFPDGKTYMIIPIGMTR